MLLNLSQLHYLYQKELSIQLLATFGTSPVVMAPVFNILCLALAGLALMYLLHLLTSDVHIHGHIPLRATPTVMPNIVLYPSYRYFPRHEHMHGYGYGNTHIHGHASSSPHHVSSFPEIHVHPSASTPHISSSGRTHGHS